MNTSLKITWLAPIEDLNCYSKRLWSLGSLRFSKEINEQRVSPIVGKCFRLGAGNQDLW